MSGKSLVKHQKKRDCHVIVMLLLDRAVRQLWRSFLPGHVIASKILQLVNCVPSVFVDGSGVRAQNARAGVPDDLGDEDRRYTCLGQSTRERVPQVINPKKFQPGIL
jgi:hypothetical protein